MRKLTIIFIIKSREKWLFTIADETSLYIYEFYGHINFLC